MILEPKKKAVPLRARKYRAAEFRPMTTTLAMQNAIARCRPDTTQRNTKVPA